MKQFAISTFTHQWWLVLLLLFASSVTAQPQQVDSFEYRLDKHDKFQVHVLGEEDLSVELTVNDQGMVFYPLLGELSVAGKTPNEVKTMIASRLKGPYLVNPKVSLTMVEYRQYFIGGAVKKPGSYSYSPGLTLIRAINDAGGFTDLASKRKLYVTSENNPGSKPVKKKPGYLVHPGDTITVKESFF